MKHAYLIIAHDNFEQLKVLLSLLDNKRNHIFLHIDRKVNKDVVPDFSKAMQYSQLRMVPPVSVSWGGFSQIRSEMQLIRTAVQAGEEYDYLHLLSGRDLPIKTNDEIFDFFGRNPGLEFVKFVYQSPNDGTVDALKSRIAYYHPGQELLGRRFSMIRRAMEKSQRAMHIDRLKRSSLQWVGKGSNWFSITEDFARYLVDNETVIHETFKSSFCADEMFLQTMILNSPFKDRIYHPDSPSDYGDNMRLIDWTRGQPYTFRSSDLEELRSSSMLFARKFDQNVDRDLIMQIKDDLHSRS